MQLRNRSLTILFDLPEEVSDEEVARFAADALETMGGCRHPEDPLFNSLSVKSVTFNGTKFINDPKKF